MALEAVLYSIKSASDESAIRSVGTLEREKKARDVERGRWSAELRNICRPCVPARGVIGESIFHRRNHLVVAHRDRAGIRFEHEARISFLVSGKDVVYDHRADGGKSFLDDGSASLADEKVTFTQQAWHFSAPPDNGEWTEREAAHLRDRFVQTPVPSDCDGKLNLIERT